MKEDFKSILNQLFALVKIQDEDESTARLESALYSAGRPLSIEELIRASGTESRTKTLNLVEKLMNKAKNYVQSN
uniref:Chromosome segregation and condensation protein (ScpB) n=1 Tax=uncultured marine thaumarchaeote KM3_03_D08 TaxID=1455960 RepID=A0A075G2X8_9ARCH|nr:chromosome segregation and condensation protein (scpB) [uncultured marine thaumarchaeote KM3_03_D08]